MDQLFSGHEGYLIHFNAIPDRHISLIDVHENCLRDIDSLLSAHQKHLANLDTLIHEDTSP
jgi:hypothetical protein